MLIRGSHQKVMRSADLVEYDGNYHKENEAAVYSEKLLQ